jgi:hypothetical protein
VAWGCEWRGGCRERQQHGRPAHAAVQGCRGCACSGAGLACREMMGCWAGAGHTRVPARVACQASGNMLPRVLEMQASWQAGRQAGRQGHSPGCILWRQPLPTQLPLRTTPRPRSQQASAGRGAGWSALHKGRPGGGGDGSDCRLGLSRFMRFMRFKSEQSGMHTPRHGGLSCSAAASAQTPARSPGCAAAAAGAAAAAAAAAAVRAVPLGASWLGASSTAASRASTSAASDSPGAVKCLGLG